MALMPGAARTLRSGGGSSERTATFSSDEDVRASCSCGGAAADVPFVVGGCSVAAVEVDVVIGGGMFSFAGGGGGRSSVAASIRQSQPQSIKLASRDLTTRLQPLPLLNSTIVLHPLLRPTIIIHSRHSSTPSPIRRQTLRRLCRRNSSLIQLVQTRLRTVHVPTHRILRLRLRWSLH